MIQELVSNLVGQLGINENQAKGGAGLIFKLAQEKLSEGDFSKISNALGGGLSSLINAAPKASEGGVASGVLGTVSTLLGGASTQFGSLASLAGGFKSLDLDISTISKFAPIVLDFVQKQAGPEIKGLVEKVIK